MRCLLGLLAATTLVWALATCRPPEQPPVAPPGPIDPTVAHAAITFHPSDVIDASIVVDGGPSIDGSVFNLDAGASAR